ncbi:MAG: alpha/beta hydrolase [Candidatus Marinimicrobia bacterium]|nr:alpha/beta hydrolase [Candidatus Neomarinimicrobiota bacterium]
MKLFKLMFALMRILFGILSVLAPRLAARWAYKMFFTPMGLPRPDSEMPQYESANHSSMAYNGKKVALYTWGDGAETILLLHGWASRGTRMGHLAEALVERGYKVIAFDMPAHGDSEGKTTNLFEISELTAQICDMNGPIHSVIAHSFGGMALCNAVHRYNLNVNRAVLVASPFTMKYIFESFAAMMNITQKVSDMMVERIRRRFLEERKADVYELSVDSFAKTLNFPFLVIHDRDDKDISYSQGEGYANNLPDVEFVTTEGLGHRRILKEPEIMNKIIKFASAGRLINEIK